MKIILVVVLSLMGLVITLWAGVFYWYDYRPNQIRKECLNWVEENNKGDVEISTSTSGTISFQGEIFVRGAFYVGCLRDHGLE